jgi:GNAT superfamily N-acetyltransferase
MPRLVDPHDIRQLLRQDPVWSVYALCDLSPRMFPKTRWFVPDLTLVLHEYGTCILFAVGSRSVSESLHEVTWPVHLQVQRAALDEVGRYATIASAKPMWRLGWTDRTRLAPPSKLAPPNELAQRLSPRDVPALRRLYADGDASGEAPDFFMADAVTGGSFHGVFEGEALTAAAGTHVISREEGVATVGNVYTRRDRRGRGLSRLVTTAVLRDLASVETVGLNVRADNGAAIGLYESLGFSRHCQFHEALATGWRDGSRP